MREFILATLAVGIVVLAGLYLYLPDRVAHTQAPLLQKGRAVVAPAVAAANANNTKIKTFSCALRVTSQAGNALPVRLHGRLEYEKPKNFLLELDSPVGPELRVGSNDKTFWFWSRRMRKPGLYWATHENFQKTRLKTPFNPAWLSACLGLDEVGGAVEDLGDRLRVLTPSANSKGEPVTFVTYLSREGRVTGGGVYDRDNRLAASSEIVAFAGGLPAKITFRWYEEDASATWTLYDPRVNAGAVKDWRMPDITPKIDMSVE